MALIDDLLGEIQNQLGHARRLNLNRRSAVNDIFEAYAFSIVLDAAIREGATRPLKLRDTGGNSCGHAIFRTSPGAIFSSTSPRYTHAVIEFASKPLLELHQGIYISGRSGLLHECDLAIVLQSEAETCRQSRVHPRCAKVVFASECKFYGAGLGIALARGFLGLTTDISKQSRFFVSNSASRSSRKLLTHHDREWAENLAPGNDTVTNRFRSLIERVFEKFKASN